MKKLKRIALSLVFGMCCLAGGARATNDSNLTITQVGINPGASWAYFYVAEALSGGCPNNLLLITLGDVAGSGKILYATVLGAELAGKKLAWVSYTLTSGNCYVSQVGVAP